MYKSKMGLWVMSKEMISVLEKGTEMINIGGYKGSSSVLAV